MFQEQGKEVSNFPTVITARKQHVTHNAPLSTTQRQVIPISTEEPALTDKPIPKAPWTTVERQILTVSSENKQLEHQLSTNKQYRILATTDLTAGICDQLLDVLVLQNNVRVFFYIFI